MQSNLRGAFLQDKTSKMNVEQRMPGLAKKFNKIVYLFSQGDGE
jgi:hypothetical protein